MGLFDWLKKEQSNVEIAADRIWLTKEAKLKGISSKIAETLADHDGPNAILLVAHFSNYFEELRRLVEQGRFDKRSVLMAMAEDLTGYSTALTDFGESQWLQIVVAERHPLLSRNEALITFAQTIPCRCCIVSHVSLEDPIIQVFMGEGVKNILMELGMREDDAIEGKNVSHRIQGCLRKIEKLSTGDEPAKSAEEWLDRNCPVKHKNR